MSLSNWLQTTESFKLYQSVQATTLLVPSCLSAAVASRQGVATLGIGGCWSLQEGFLDSILGLGGHLFFFPIGQDHFLWPHMPLGSLLGIASAFSAKTGFPNMWNEWCWPHHLGGRGVLVRMWLWHPTDICCMHLPIWGQIKSSCFYYYVIPYYLQSSILSMLSRLHSELNAIYT